jgi:RNA polymerase-binding transcription factor DksA
MATKKQPPKAARKISGKPAKAAKPARAAAKAPAKKTATKTIHKPAPKKAAPARAKGKPAPAAKKAVKAVAKKAAAPKKPMAKANPKKEAPKKAPVAAKKVAAPAKKAPATQSKKQRVSSKPAATAKKAEPAKKPAVQAPSTKEVKPAIKPLQAPAKKPAPKPTKVVIPKTSTTKAVKYSPDFTKSVLDAQKREQTGPTMRYSDAELVEFRELITRKLETAKKELAYLQGLITRKDEGGDMEDGRYMTMEDGSMSMEREQLSQMASRQIQFIDHLEKAMMRIENKTYGVCRVTGKLIDKARLRAVPHATLSIEAKQLMNK